MRTSKFISTISYNTPYFLETALNNLIKENYIVFWAYIEHLPESGETKKHKHLFIQPNGCINTDNLKDCFVEAVPDSNIPLNIMPFRVSKIEDCLLYFLHDVKYLNRKCIRKKYHYQLSDFHCSNADYLVELYYSLDLSKFGNFDTLVENSKLGVRFSKLVANGLVPFQQIKNLQLLYEYLLYENFGRVNTVKKSDLILLPTQNKFNF